MNYLTNLFTSESVSIGHPDKICDQVADAILDYALKRDPSSHVACECFATTDKLIIGGEITSACKIPYKRIAKKVIQEIGYDKDEYGFNYKTVKIINLVKTQSHEINNSVISDDILELGAGDQGIMFGYATDETKELMPLAISISQNLLKTATFLRLNDEFRDARPDMKSQVTIDYNNPNNIKIHTVVMSVQHNPDINLEEFRKYIIEKIIKPTLDEYGVDYNDTIFLVNPSGSFVLGGPAGDTGLTGRKIIVDTYGGAARHGGGSFSGKDPSKVDRSASYMARYIAKNLVAAGVAKRIEVQLSYAIGRSEPISLSFSTFGTSKYSDEEILDVIEKVFDLRVGAIISNFSMLKPKFSYLDLARNGHFGREDAKLPWEKLDKVKEIRTLLK